MFTFLRAIQSENHYTNCWSTRNTNQRCKPSTAIFKDTFKEAIQFLLNIQAQKPPLFRLPNLYTPSIVFIIRHQQYSPLSHNKLSNSST